ncbi:restriction endonuclease subunit S [Conexibacter woesei]|uniref:restriction endonuclease subunit S n=1 Tax=Conexibacter woesei TaxID=191495 RepID=UPI0004021DDB|nr:restriction endonuclease subunit S [Conexibacter woesei]
MTSDQSPPPGWRLHRLGDVAEIFDGPHATPKKTSAGPVFLGISSLTNGRLDLADLEHLSEEDFIRWTRRITPREGDVVFSYETRLGEAAAIPSGLRCCLGRRMGLLRPRDQIVRPRFLLYAYLGPQFQETIRERTIHGSTVDRIPLKEMGTFPIALPPLDEQERIESILAALDARYEHNHALGARELHVAHHIFRSMFGGRIEGDDQLGNHVTVTRGRSYKSSELTGDDRALVTLKSVRAGGGYNPDGLKPYLGDYRPPQVVQPGELVVAHTDLTQAAAVIGKPAIVPDTGSFSELVASLDLAIVRPSGLSVSIPFLYFLFLEPSFQQHAYGYANGSTVLHLAKEAVGSFPFVAPDRERHSMFGALATPLLNHRDALIREARGLAKIRDVLLPALMLGQLGDDRSAALLYTTAAG